MALTSKQALFIASYKLTGKATESAISAGYSAKSAAVEGNRMLKNPKILAEIESWRAKKAQEFTREDFVDKALRDYEGTPLIEANRPRFLELAGKGAGILGAGSDQKGQTINNLTQINISGGESQPQLWDLTRKLLGND